jgi:3-methylcrotonyl-CoA carboxylase alpha subunit
VIKKLFIANRGEVCRRIAQTARLMGIHSTTLCVDKKAPWYILESVDEIIYEERTEKNIYLDAERLIAIAKKADCDSVHPGFGFLSENAEFARLCQSNGLIWIGPSPESMELMASKTQSRDVALKANVPVNAAFEIHSESDIPKAAQHAKKMGYPVLVKAAFGGGGKGMRRVESEAELEEAIARCRSEAKNSFGNDLVFVEKYIQRPRHIEVQILSDGKNCIVLGDRDCTFQRRHQKVIEEAPAPFLTDEQRQKLHAFAKRLAEQVHYVSVGTMEFLFSEGSFYFLEMNTRLQVEHTVTEEIFATDLVMWQIKVASGESLEGVSFHASGHSIQARIYAEDPAAGFIPSADEVLMFKPCHQTDVRWELGLDRSSEISAEYDPMIAKLVVWAPDRELAARKLEDVLSRSWICGPAHNQFFVRELVASKAFAQASFDTGYIEREMKPVQDWAKWPFEPNLLRTFLKKSTDSDIHSILESAFGEPRNEDMDCDIYDCTYHQSPSGADVYHLCGLYGGQPFEAVVALEHSKDRYWFMYKSQQSYYEIVHQSLGAQSRQESDEALSPVPGKVVKVAVTPGQEVKKGETLIIIESMKMEFSVKAMKDATIKSVRVKVGEQLKAGVQLIDWEA